MTGSVMKVGFAKRDITPPIGLPMAGYGARSGYSAGIGDPLYTRAFTVYNETQGKRLAIITSDLVAYDAATLTAFRSRVEDETGVAPDDVIVAVTHTHSGPAYGSFYDFYSSSPNTSESEKSASWGRELPSLLIAALKEAVASEARVEIALVSTEASISVHRRFIDPLGEVRLSPNPTGITDSAVSILQATDVDNGRVVGTLINYACHPVVLCEDNLLYSGDYPAYALDVIEQTTGAPALFINGTCGNINPRERGDFEAARALGAALAADVLQAVEATPRHTNLFISTEAKQVALPLKHATADAFDTYTRTAEKAYAAHRNPENFEGKRLHDEVVRARGIAERIGRRQRRLEGLTDSNGNLLVRIQTARLGPASVVALPGEVFVEFGLEIRRQAPGQLTFVLGYTNEAIGYVPTRNAYAEGGYEVDVSHIAPGAGETLIKEALSSLQGLEANS
jgi:neutral ceramidase